MGVAVLEEGRDRLNLHLCYRRGNARHTRTVKAFRCGERPPPGKVAVEVKEDGDTLYCVRPFVIADGNGRTVWKTDWAWTVKFVRCAPGRASVALAKANIGL